jgi:pyruvate/2-oxoglutarate dehydrogenase complex dihydrolipoamide dehydrogenase (E3) component
METALLVAGRGHDVTLYEKSDSLGGLLNISNYPAFKWTLKAFKNYLVSQIKKSSVKVNLNTEATAEALKSGQYDAVFVAVGAEPVVPDIPGVNGKNVVFARDVYGNEDSLAEAVVVIGGGETGMETGMYLAEKGHKVTVLEEIDAVGYKAAPLHYYSMAKAAWDATENLNYFINARCTAIGDGSVTYIDKNGQAQSLPAECVVIAAGYQPQPDRAIDFAAAGARLFMVGDCNRVGNVQTVIRSAYSSASMI